MTDLRFQSSHFTSNMLNAIHEPFFLLSEKGEITDTNEAFCLRVGLPKNRIVGTHYSVYFLNVDNDSKHFSKRFDAQHRIQSEHLQLKNRSGLFASVLLKTTLFTDETDKFCGVYATLIEQIDITNTKKELAKAQNEISCYMAALDASAIVAITDETGIIQYVNQNFCTISKYNREELMGQDHRLVNSYFHPKEYIKDLWFTISNKNIWRGELKNKAKDGTFYWVDTTIVPFLDEKDNIYQYVSVHTDITAQKLLSNYSRSLIEASRDPLFTISPEGKITDVNNASMRITELKREQLIGHDFKNYFTEPQKAFEGYQAVFENGFVTDYPLSIVDGKITDVLFNGSVYKDDKGNVLGAVVVARDISEQKKIEKELIDAKTFAESAQLKAEFATHTAEDAVKAKQQFLSNMSHEIRTPMNAIIGFTKVVLKTDLTAKQTEYLTAIQTSGDALIVLINDILDLAKVDAGKMSFEKIPFNMEKVLSIIFQLVEGKTREKKLELLFEFDEKIPKVLLGDPLRLHQIMLNLLSNAVKFTMKGKIIVSAQILLEDTDSLTIEFSVKDTGIGIKDARKDSIFDHFQQATSGTSRLYGGTGLGLAIVKQLVESQGGTIRVESHYKEGSDFRFQLKFQKTDEEICLDESTLIFDPENKNISVLVVEDIEINQLLMKTILDDFGFQQDTASNGKIAIEKILEKHFDIVLMDLQMPVMDGFTATSILRKEWKITIPIIALTADVTTVDLAKCKAVGMNDYLSKPIDEHLLYRKIIQHNTLHKARMKAKSVDLAQQKIVDLTYLKQLTKKNPALMLEIITLFLDQTPKLIRAMNTSLVEKDWLALNGAVHKLIPSFYIMGITHDMDKIARHIQSETSANQSTEGMATSVLAIEKVCAQAVDALRKDVVLITNNETNELG
jgi:PAS domain S-box-containing protein